MPIPIDYFSLLIPFVLLLIIFSTLFFASRKRLTPSLSWFILAIICSFSAQFAQTVLLPKDIYLWAIPICSMFFLSVVFTAHAVYLRLNIPTQWHYIWLTFITAQLFLVYFCFIYPSLDARFIIVAVTSALICLNHPKQLLLSKHTYRLDQLLKYSFYGMIVAILLRAVLLTTYFNQENWLAFHAYIWAITQLLILFFVVLFILIFISIMVHDTIVNLKQEGLLDPLTQLHNRRALTEILQQRFDSKKITQHTHAILLCDIDHFKKINDRYGHLIGDGILQQLSHQLKNYLLEKDIIARIGGEEFAMILCNVTEAIAIERAQTICNNISEHHFVIEHQNIKISVSIGLSFFNHLDQYDTAFKQADELLYQAKRSGRNHVQYMPYSIAISPK